jgi:hypothetical protein
VVITIREEKELKPTADKLKCYIKTVSKYGKCGTPRRGAIIQIRKCSYLYAIGNNNYKTN